MNMNLKKSALLLSLAAIPAATIMSEEASANTYPYVYDYTQVNEVIRLIQNIDPTSASYEYYLTEAKKAYDYLTDAERYYVSNSNDLFNYLGYNYPGYNEYYQTYVQTFITKVNAISTAKSSFLRDVQEANRYYDSLTVSEKSALPYNYVTQLTTYNDNIAKMRAVENSFKLLTTADVNYTTNYLAVLRDYNALPYSYRLLIQAIADEKAQQYNQYHSVEYNRAAAQKVVTAISNLTSSSSTKAVANVRTMYNDLTTLQQSYVTNVRELQYIEDVQNNIPNGWDPYYYDEDKDDYDEDDSDITINQRGSTYYINMPVSEMNRYKATEISVSDNITLKIPRSAIPVTNTSAVVAMTIDDNEDYGFAFSASLYNENLEFSQYIDIEVKGLRSSDVFMRIGEKGEYVAAPFGRVLNRHVIKTKTSGEYVIKNETPLFFDIRADGHRYEIEQLAKRKIVSGVETNYYKPGANVTISQYAAMISRAMDLTAKNHSTYIDVQGKWYEDSIEALIEAGIIEDKKSNYFNPGQVVTRKQAAQMSIRMLQHAGISISDPDYARITFPDFYQMSTTERYYVALANEFGIFGGKENGRFDPNGQLTRSQMAKVLYRTLQIAKMM